MEGGEAHASGEATQRRQRATVSDSGAGTSLETTPRPHVSGKAPLVWRAPEGAAAVPVGGGEARASTRAPSSARLEAAAWPAGPGRASNRCAEPRSATQPHWCGGRRRELQRCRWAVAGPGRASRRRAERSSRRGRLAGGPPPTGTHSGRALRRPKHPWDHVGRWGESNPHPNAAAGNQAAARHDGARKTNGATRCGDGGNRTPVTRHSKRGRHQPTPCASALTHP